MNQKNGISGNGAPGLEDDLNKNENVRHYMEDKIKQDKLMQIIVDAAIEK